jgi:hypothetical protein
MGRLDERDLTRLSFLMASLVASPELWTRLIGRVLRGEPASSPYAEVVAQVEQLLSERSVSHPADVDSLRDVADRLLEGDDEARTAGRALSAALESAPSKPRRAAGMK